MGINTDWPKVRRDPKDKRRSGKLWSPEIVLRFLDELHRDARDEVEFVLLTNLRLTEMKRAEADWVEPAPPESETPAVLRMPDWASKTDARIVGLPQRALEIIARRLEENPDAKKVFSQRDFRTHRSTVCRRMGLPMTITLRDMRHTYGSLAIHDPRVSPVDLMRAMGHKDLRTTELYMSSTQIRIAGVSAAVEQAMQASVSISERSVGSATSRKELSGSNPERKNFTAGSNF